MEKFLARAESSFILISLAKNMWALFTRASHLAFLLNIPQCRWDHSRHSYIWPLPLSETKMRGTDKAATRSYVSAGALNSAIKTPAHVYYFILVPEPPRLKRIHNYRCLREPLNLSHAPARTNVIYACVDFNSHAARRIVAAYDRAPAYVMYT